MKKIRLSITALLLCALFVSCDNNKKNQAEKDISALSSYVDSITIVSKEKLVENWGNIEKTYSEKKLQAQSSAEAINDNFDLNKKVTVITSKFVEFKTKFQIEKDKILATQKKINLRRSLFNKNEIDDNLNFNWVDKENIVLVYEDFVTAVSKNQVSYSREDWDEINLMYKALNIRKKTVEKEGLTSSDNIKIAGLKIKFAKIYALNSIVTKSEENAAAKK